MANDYVRDLLRLVEKKGPDSILAIAPDARRMFAPYLDAHPGCTFTSIRVDEAQQLEGYGRFHFGFVGETLECLPKHAAEAVLARLRDIHAKRLCVLLPIGPRAEGQTSEWEHTEMIAYGMTLLARYRSGGRELCLYGFDIASYKQTPDWLNPRYWAHPELWDKYRW